MDFRHWLHGLVATFVNGFASGIVLIVADPITFNLQAGMNKLLTVSALLGLIGAANYLKKSPLPDRWKDAPEPPAFV